MSMPSPFEMGKAIGGNVSGGVRSGVEQGAIGQILQQAQQIEDPNQINNLMNQILPRISEENRPMVEKALEQKKTQITNQRTQEQFVKVADSIEKNNPESTLHKIIADVYRSDIPVAQKEALVKNLTSTTPFKIEQQQRLQSDSIVKNYNSLIREIDTEIARGARANRKKELLERRDRLVKERDVRLDFDALKEELPEFDSKNEEHVKLRDTVLEEAKGDRAKANEELAKVFK